MPVIRVDGAVRDLPPVSTALLEELRGWLQQPIDAPGLKPLMEYNIQMTLQQVAFNALGTHEYIDVLVEKIGRYGDSVVVIPQNMRTLLTLFQQFPRYVPEGAEVFEHDGLTWHLVKNSAGIVYKALLESRRY